MQGGGSPGLHKGANTYLKAPAENRGHLAFVGGGCVCRRFHYPGQEDYTLGCRLSTIEPSAQATLAHLLIT